MCISIVVAANVAGSNVTPLEARIAQLGRVYGYGIGMSPQKLLPEARGYIADLFGGTQVIFEAHDPAEPHCACDIDQDIRNGSRLDKPSKFFDFIKEILEYRGLATLSVLIFQEQVPEPGSIRRQVGTYTDFVDLLNCWNTWQVGGFEPTRQAYFVADESPLLFTFTDKHLLQ